MKALILAVFVAFGSYASDLGFVVESYKKVPGMDYQLELVVKNQEFNHRFLLDCQSFINGLHYMKKVGREWEDEWFLMLAGNDCEDISNYAYGAIENSAPFCMKVNIDNRNVDFNEDVQNCNQGWFKFK